MTQTATLTTRANRKEFRVHGKLPVTDARKRNALMISMHLKMRKSSIAQVARDLGVSYPAVYNTAIGISSSKRVLARLRQMGIPDMYLVSNGASK